MDRYIQSDGEQLEGKERKQIEDREREHILYIPGEVNWSFFLSLLASGLKTGDLAFTSPLGQDIATNPRHC